MIGVFVGLVALAWFARHVADLVAVALVGLLLLPVPERIRVWRNVGALVVALVLLTLAIFTTV